MQNIYTIGETVYDLIFTTPENINAKAGGAMLNTAVSLGRLNLPVNLISEYGNDKAGNIIEDFLISNGVKTKHVSRFDEGQTAISLAFLNNRKEAEYSFYKMYPNERFNNEFPEIKENDIILFGSFFSLDSKVRNKIMNFIYRSKESKAIIIYDPNIRKPHKDKIDSLRDLIIENISVSDFVRASDEDFSVIFNTDNPKSAYEKTIKFNCKNLVYTASNKGVFLFTPNIQKKYDVKKIKTLSTIGAGDSFNAGIIFSIVKNKILKSGINDLNKKDFDKMINAGITFSADVCTSYENYISKNLAAEIIKSNSF